MQQNGWYTVGDVQEWLEIGREMVQNTAQMVQKQLKS